MDRRVTEVVIDVLPRGFDSDERRVLIIRPPDERFDVRLSDRLRDVGIDTFGFGSEKRADYILAPAVRNASGGPVPTVIEFALVGVAAAVVAAGGNDTYNALKRFVRSLDAGEPKALTDAEAVVWGLRDDRP